jgi:hypothetical protein
VRTPLRIRAREAHSLPHAGAVVVLDASTSNIRKRVRVFRFFRRSLQLS